MFCEPLPWGSLMLMVLVTAEIHMADQNRSVFISLVVSLNQNKKEIKIDGPN